MKDRLEAKLTKYGKNRDLDLGIFIATVRNVITGFTFRVVFEHYIDSVDDTMFEEYHILEGRHSGTYTGTYDILNIEPLND